MKIPSYWRFRSFGLLCHTDWIGPSNQLRQRETTPLHNYPRRPKKVAASAHGFSREHHILLHVSKTLCPKSCYMAHIIMEAFETEPHPYSMNMEDCFVLSRLSKPHSFPDRRQRDHHLDGDLNLICDPFLRYRYFIWPISGLHTSVWCPSFITPTTSHTPPELLLIPILSSLIGYLAMLRSPGTLVFPI